MTEGQRDYLADLAGRKGVRLDDTDNVSRAWASKKIDELKALPDAAFELVSAEQTLELGKSIARIREEMGRWIFQE